MDTELILLILFPIGFIISFISLGKGWLRYLLLGPIGLAITIAAGYIYKDTTGVVGTVGTVGLIFLLGVFPTTKKKGKEEVLEDYTITNFRCLISVIIHFSIVFYLCTTLN